MPSHADCSLLLKEDDMDPTRVATMVPSRLETKTGTQSAIQMETKTLIDGLGISCDSSAGTLSSPLLADVLSDSSGVPSVGPGPGCRLISCDGVSVEKRKKKQR